MEERNLPKKRSLLPFPTSSTQVRGCVGQPFPLGKGKSSYYLLPDFGGKFTKFLGQCHPKEDDNGMVRYCLKTPTWWESCQAPLS